MSSFEVFSEGHTNKHVYSGSHPSFSNMCLYISHLLDNDLLEEKGA